ncbi:hypothetical protein ORI20_02565 [Mycobacterium sp. CVI_P3]|uniref:Pyridine nucleotide-disulfide oxidoreductase n=1 Tax=Mycobacterium pinniadriaticum TaxID=2994102 RepID=A0ABT3S7V3_9MYCO|nr:hypothetical protein [Mycobacterium pinniadriaticum]MCX2929142.1 hypothetical protein [Mycobacterium pinniadriaticum]MCX2935567.1 hypothetical protein [Mycobacterium pinniadriaticum]
MITADDVRRLLDRQTDAVLVLVEGRIKVVEPAELDTDAYRGALQVITRAELVEQAGGEQLSDRELAEQAAALDTAVSELGG